MQIGSLPPRPSPREAGGGRGGKERGRGRGPGRGRRGARKRDETGPGPRAPRAGQGAAGSVCSPPSGLLRAGAPRLPLLPLPPAGCMRSSRAGILRARRPARSPGRPPAPPRSFAPPSGAEPAGRGLRGAGEPHSDTGGRPARRRSPDPARRKSGRRGAPVLQPARSQPSASTLLERPIRAQRGRRAAGLAALPPPAARAVAARLKLRELRPRRRRRREPGAGAHGAPAAGDLPPAAEGTQHAAVDSKSLPGRA